MSTVPFSIKSTTDTTLIERNCFSYFKTFFPFFITSTEIESMDSYNLCSFIPNFIRKGTNLKCSMKKKKMAIVYRGIRAAANECLYQFRMRPWNCSIAFESEPRIAYHRKFFILLPYFIFNFESSKKRLSNGNVILRLQLIKNVTCYFVY